MADNCYESENDSDEHNDHSAEATDDSIIPNQMSKDPIETNFESLPSESSCSDDDHVCSPCEETESTTPRDVDTSVDSKQSNSSNDVCLKSHCVPYTSEENQNDENSIFKDTITTPIIDYFNPEPKKDKNNIGHIMISYNHSTRPICSKISKELRKLHYLVWIDQDNITGNVITAMASAVENAYVVLMAINEQYSNSRYCRLEAEYAIERNKPSIPMLMQADYMDSSGWLGIINGSKFQIDFSKFTFDEAFRLLVREIEAVRISLGADGNDRINVPNYMDNQYFITTMNNTWGNSQNIDEWSADDVAHWLHQEKLEIFQNPLTNFTGKTLHQLFKMKLDSPPNYYTTVESLLSPNTALRLFYILTFTGAIESLFTTSNR